MTLPHNSPLRPAAADDASSPSGEVFSPAIMQNKAVIFRDFSFAEHARDFDRHIRTSIPGYDELHRMCVWLSRDFVQNETMIIDIGCTTGKLLRAVRNWNQVSRPAASYLGIDKDQCWQEAWRKRRASNLRFEVCDARSFDGFKDLSLAYDLFTLQFIPERDRLGLLRRIHDGLIEGGALIIAAKVLANSAWSQDALTAYYHERKRQRGLSDKHILDKQLNLRGQMVLWTEARLMDALREAGFQEIQRFWQSYLFVAMVARKNAPQPSASIVPISMDNKFPRQALVLDGNRCAGDPA